MLQISKADYDLIRWEAERSYPNECCGIILGLESGENRLVTLTITCDNARRDSPKDRYSIHPEQVVAAHKLARSRQHPYRFPAKPLQHRSQGTGAHSTRRPAAR
jgi:proteasome lid subunit RPN8/RPN11